MSPSLACGFFTTKPLGKLHSLSLSENSIQSYSSNNNNIKFYKSKLEFEISIDIVDTDIFITNV